MSAQITLTFDSYNDMESWVREQSKIRKAAAPEKKVAEKKSVSPKASIPAPPPVTDGIPRLAPVQAGGVVISTEDPNF